MGRIVSGPWKELRKEQVLFSTLSEDFAINLRFYSSETRQALQQASTPFKMNSDINPIHCRKALNVLEHLHERLDKLCQSLSQSSSLPIMLSPSRYPMLIDLRLTQKNATRLMDQLDEYRVCCLKSSPRLYPQRREIMLLFDKVMRQLDSVSDQVPSLERDIEAQEQRLSTMVKMRNPT